MERGLLIGAAYFLGAVPFGLLIGRLFYGVDIREHGSKNVGATNVWRTLGKGPGAATLALDGIKGFLPVWAALRFPDETWLALSCGAAAIAGHNWSVFLAGKGGKGVATSAGVFLALLPKPMGVALAAFLVLFLTTRHVSVGSMGAAAALFAGTFVFETEPLLRALVLVAAILILLKHRPNIDRMRRGEEPKVRF